jgi:hypothetical protein
VLFCYNQHVNSMKSKLFSNLFRTGIVFMTLVMSMGAMSAQVYKKIERKELLKILSSQGYTATEAESERNVIWTLNGYKTLLLVAENMESIQFYVAFSDSKSTLSRVNTWNKEKKYSRSYLDNDGDPVLELDLDLAGGVTRERIVDFLLTCRVSLSAWKTSVVD